MSKNCLVIGAGFGGIASALRLRRLGFNVTIVDKNPHLGGRAQVYKRGEFKFDAGPTVLTAPFLIDDLFSLFSCLAVRMQHYAIRAVLGSSFGDTQKTKGL